MDSFVAAMSQRMSQRQIYRRIQLCQSAEAHSVKMSWIWDRLKVALVVSVVQGAGHFSNDMSIRDFA